MFCSNEEKTTKNPNKGRPSTDIEIKSDDLRFKKI